MKKYFSIILLATAITSLTGCLKDDNANLTDSNSPAVVEFSSANTELAASPVGSTYTLYSRAYDRAPSVDVPFTVNYTGGDVAPKDIKVSFGIKPDAITQYEAERLTNDHTTIDLTLLPAQFYTLPGDVVIKKGERTATAILKFKSDAITDFGSQFVVPLSITAAEGVTVSGNYGTILAKLSVKNPYDGAYKIAGTITRYLSGTSNPDTGLGGTYPSGGDAFTSNVVTTGATTNTFQLFWKDGSGIAGIDGLFLTIDPATNLVTVATNPATVLANTPGQVNAYDPATKTFKLHFTWGASNKRIANITLTYFRAR